jgi:hypothetical protein
LIRRRRGGKQPWKTVAIARWVGSVDRERLDQVLDGKSDPEDLQALLASSLEETDLPTQRPQAGRLIRRRTMKTNEARSLLRKMFEAAITAAQPAHCVPLHLPEPPRGRLIVIGAGKASAAMARALEETWPGELSGVVVTRYGYAVPCQRIEIVEAAHPVPDAAGVAAAQRIHALVQGLRRRRYRAVPDLGRRLVAARPAARRAELWRTSRM